MLFIHCYRIDTKNLVKKVTFLRNIKNLLLNIISILNSVDKAESLFVSFSQRIKNMHHNLDEKLLLLIYNCHMVKQFLFHIS